jgi:hypothetical protein
MNYFDKSEENKLRMSVSKVLRELGAENCITVVAQRYIEDHYLKLLKKELAKQKKSQSKDEKESK